MDVLRCVYPFIHPLMDVWVVAVVFVFVFFRLFAISWAAPVAYGGSQVRGRIGAIAAGLHHSHSSARSKPRLRPTPQLTAKSDP